MPLVHGYSQNAIRKNVEKLIREDRSPRQASAIACERARVWWRFYHGQKSLPSYLRKT
jgi:hypothetical protein